MPGIFEVKDLWTLSIRFISDLCQGDQTTVAYSTWGLTKVVNICFKKSVFLTVKFRRMQEEALRAADATLWQWYVNLRSVDM